MGPVGCGLGPEERVRIPTTLPVACVPPSWVRSQPQLDELAPRQLPQEHKHVSYISLTSYYSPLSGRAAFWACHYSHALPGIGATSLHPQHQEAGPDPTWAHLGPPSPSPVRAQCVYTYIMCTFCLRAMYSSGAMVHAAPTLALGLSFGFWARLDMEPSQRPQDLEEPLGLGLTGVCPQGPGSDHASVQITGPGHLPLPLWSFWAIVAPLPSHPLQPTSLWASGDKSGSRSPLGSDE